MKSTKRPVSPREKAKSVRLPERILLIEDDEAFAQAFMLALEKVSGSEVVWAADSFEVGNLMSQQPFDLVITDWKLPFFNGFSTLRKAEQSLSLDPAAPAVWFGKQNVPMIVITACDSKEIERERQPKGCFQFLGVVSKEQVMERILEQVKTLYGNAHPLSATA